MLVRTNCPCCESSKTTVKLRLDYNSEVLSESTKVIRYHYDISDKSYVIRKCDVCDLYFQEIVLDDSEAKVVYSLFAPENIERIRKVEELAHFAEDAMLIRLLFPDRQPVVLDFGMNTGIWAQMASAYGCDCYGTDIAEFSKSFAAKKGIKFIEFSELPDNYFDFINADQVFEHLANPLEILKRLAPALNHNGIIKISCPGDKRIEEKIRILLDGKVDVVEFSKKYDSISPFIHLNLFNEKSLVMLGARAGLERIRIPLRLSYSTMTLFNSMRQINRNFYRPLKQYLARGTWQFFRKGRAK